MASTANWRASNEDEQAVSTENEGPCRSKVKEMRFENIERTHPVSVYPVTVSGSCVRAPEVSEAEHPTNTPVREPRRSVGLIPEKTGKVE